MRGAAILPESVFNPAQYPGCRSAQPLVMETKALEMGTEWLKEQIS